MPKATKDEIVALEREYWDAMKRKDGKRTSQLSGKVSLTTGARGVTSIPKAKMGEMTEEGNWTLESYEFSDVEVPSLRKRLPRNADPCQVREL